MPAYAHTYRSLFTGPEYTGTPATLTRSTTSSSFNDGTVSDGTDTLWAVDATVTEDVGDNTSFLGPDAQFIGTVIVNSTEYPVFYDLAAGASSFYTILFGGPNAMADQSFMATNASFATFTPTSKPFSPCFAEGTMIAIPDGEVAVENLKVGDMVLTAEGASVPVLWLGWQDIFPTTVTPKMIPVRIRAGALGAGVPNADLVVTANHAMEIDGLLINAGALVNGDTIAWLPLEESGVRMRVYHVETEAHSAILANGAAAETYVDYGGRQAFENYQDYLDLYGAERLIPEMDHPRISSKRLIPDAIKARLGIEADGAAFDTPLSA